MGWASYMRRSGYWVRAWRAAPGRPTWVTAAGIGAVAVAVLIWGLVAEVLPFALNTGSRIEEFSNLDLAELTSRDSSALASLERSIDAIADEVAPAAVYMEWVARFSPAFSWIPGVGHETLEWAVQVERLESALSAAAGALTASSQLLDAYREAESGLLSFDKPGSAPDVARRAVQLEASFALALETVADASVSGRRHVPVYRPPKVRAAMGLIRRIEDRMLVAFSIGRDASTLLADLSTIAEQIRPLAGQFVSDTDESGPTTVDELRAALVEMDERLRFALVRSGGLTRLVASSGQSQALRDRLDVLEDVLEVLVSVNRATVVGLNAVQPALEDKTGPEQGTLGIRLLRTLEALSESAGELDQALAVLQGARQALTDLKAKTELAGGSRSLEKLTQAVGRVHDGLQLARDMAPIGKDLVGESAVRRYLVLGQSADELRATGGFVSAVWILTFDSGALADIQYFDVVRVDDWGRLNLYPPAPLGLEEHMNARVWLIRDVSWEPDFPTTARTAADMFRIGQRQEVDGVVALNQWTLLALVEALGAVSSPEGDGDITPRNLLAKLEQGTDTHGRVYMDMALQGLLDRLNEPISLGRLMRVAAALHGSLEDRDLLLFLNDPELQAAVEDVGWDGRVRQGTVDYLYVVDSNVGWSKADRNIERRLKYRVDLGKLPRARASLSLAYYNHSGPGSTGCVPQWLNRGTNYSQLKNACYWNYWRVYIPEGSRLLSNTPLGLPEYSVAVEIGKGLPGEDTVRVSTRPSYRACSPSRREALVR